MLLVAAALVVAALGWLWLQRDGSIAFVARCGWNGNDLAVCWCTHRALPELPSGYREAAMSWSHQSSVAYARTVMLAAARRGLRHATGISRETMSRPTEAKLRDWLAAVAARTGWWAAAEAALQIGGAPLAVAVKAVPIVLREGRDLTTAHAVMQRACGARPHFLYRSAQIQQAVVDAATGTWDRVQDASASAYRTSVDATSGAWSWSADTARSLWHRRPDP